MNKKGFHHLKWEDSLKIEGAVRTGSKPAQISKMIGCCRSTICNEIERGMCTQLAKDYGFVERYCTDFAEQRYQENLCAKGPDIKSGDDCTFAEYVEEQSIKKHRSHSAACF